MELNEDDLVNKAIESDSPTQFLYDLEEFVSITPMLDGNRMAADFLVGRVIDRVLKAIKPGLYE